MENLLSPDQIIDAFGGTSAVASLCEVSDAAVSQWRTSKIPNARLMFLKLVRPDIFISNPGHAGRQPPSPTNILDTVPAHSVVLPAIPPSLDPKEKP